MFYEQIVSFYRPECIGYVFVSNLAASALTFLLLTPELLKIRYGVDLQLMKKMLAYSWPVLVANISFIINENISRMLMGFLLPAQQGMRDLGIFGACRSEERRVGKECGSTGRSRWSPCN